jgi:hypothetical protein
MLLEICQWIVFRRVRGSRRISQLYTSIASLWLYSSCMLSLTRYLSDEGAENLLQTGDGDADDHNDDDDGMNRKHRARHMVVCKLLTRRRVHRVLLLGYPWARGLVGALFASSRAFQHSGIRAHSRGRHWPDHNIRLLLQYTYSTIHAYIHTIHTYTDYGEEVLQVYSRVKDLS